MSDVFISYARSTEDKAQSLADALRAMGFGVWRDDELPPHRDYAEVIEERLRAARAVLVIWSAEAVKSQWVRAEANLAREAGTLVQVRLDDARLPLPFNQIQCADLCGWTGQHGHAELRKVADSIAALLGRDSQPRAKAIEQEIRYCVAADGVRIAYATVGAGPPLLKTANWLNHLEHDWGSPVWDAMFHRLAARHTLIRYDERGNGLSDWNTRTFSLEAFVQDMEAVADAAGLTRFPILAISQGGAVAVEYAVRHPEKVSRLILLNAFARGWRTWNPAQVETGKALKTLISLNWGAGSPVFRQLFTNLMIPTGSPRQWDWFDEMQKNTASPRNAARLFECFGGLDVRHRLAEVRAPTLVLHARDDQICPMTFGQEIAAGIPGARFVGLPTRNHILVDDDPAFARLTDEIDSFLAEDA